MNASTKELLDAARRYARKGWRPFPMSSKTQGSVGMLWGALRDREPTNDEIEKWFVDPKVDSIAVITGQKTGIVAIDIDHKGGRDGFGALEKRGIDVHTDLVGPTVRTPNGGVHVLFRHPGRDVYVPTGEIPGLLGVELKADDAGGGANVKLNGPGYEWDDARPAARTLRHLPDKLLELALSAGEPPPDDDEDEVLTESADDELPPLDAAIPKRGYLTDVVGFFTETTDVPPEYALGVGLGQLSALMTGRIAVEAWGDIIRSHLWLVFVSGPASRKTHAWKLGIRVLKEVARDLQIPADSTVPALIGYLAEERPDEANGYIFHSEMKRFLESCQQSWQAGAQDFMSELFDSLDDVGELRVTRDANIVHNPSVSIMGALTDAGFAKYARTSAILDGYLTRFVFIFRETGPIKSRGLRTAQAGGAKHDALIGALKGRYKLIRRVSGDVGDWPHVVPITDTAAAMFDEYDDELKSETVDRGVEGFRDRVMTQVLKLAMCYVVSRAKEADDFEVRAVDIRHAIAFMDYQRSRAWDVIATAAETQTRTAEYRMELRGRVQELQKKQADAAGTDWTKEWVTKRDVQRSMTNMTSRVLDGYLETLETAAEIRVWKKSAARTRYRGGRSAVLVRLTPKGWVRDRLKVAS